MTNNHNSPQDISPLGMGHEPVKDPLKGFNGMGSATLFLEAISMFLGLLVVLKIDGGSYWTSFNCVFITILGLMHLVMLGFARKPWSSSTFMVLPFVRAIDVTLLLWSITASMILSIAVSCFGLRMRYIVVQRITLGYLQT